MTDREYSTHPAVNFLSNNATFIFEGGIFYFLGNGIEYGGMLFLVFPDVQKHLATIDVYFIVMVYIDDGKDTTISLIKYK